MASKLTLLTQQKSAAQLQTMSKESIQWLQKKVGDLRNPQYIPRSIKNEKQRYTNRFVLGGLYFFYYDPKLKKELPYYDRFPLVIPLERYNDGFLGLNLHYLPIRYRLIFMDKLLDYAVLNENDDPKRLRITYELLNVSKRYPEFRPCLKRYLTSHIGSKILGVSPEEWDVALMLPVQQFKKAKPKEVWQDSVDEIKGRKNAI